ncbi:hypothetical protein [Phycicoccus flavus]|uniref:hypothetical protein n=1 Tax=Phycicoccus flavus TaxID=2502783 RepID=UPI000FEBC3BD|nr:hypothetical protein [Phycicoccus flavus]NHA68522.1 hypothetical protein [Phycicoccus flavus]
MGDRVADTYRYLRVVTPLPAVWLLLAVVALALVRGEVLESISDYYTGPLRDVFVGALMACGLGMVVFKGESGLEDTALDVAGINAVLVALVPISFQDGLDAARLAEAAGAPLPVSAADLVGNLRLALATLLVVLVLYLVADQLLLRGPGRRWSGRPPLARALTLVSWGTQLVLVAVVALVLFGAQAVLGRSLFTAVHVLAATLLVVNLSFAAASHAIPHRLRAADDAPPDGARTRRVFGLLTASMWVGLLVGGVLIVAGVPYAVLVTEVVEVVLFLGFWFTATREEWRGLVRALRPG